MSAYYYEKELGGEKENALGIVSSIKADFQRWVTSDHKDAPKNCLKYAQNLLNTFYHIYRSAKEKAHYDIFVDIYVRILSPHLDASASPSHFKNLLPHLEHLFSSLALFKLHAESEKLYKCIVEQQLQWTDVDDFKCLLGIHGTHIIVLCRQSEAAKSQKIDESLAKVTELFKFTSERNSVTEIDDFELTNLFVKSFKIYTNQGRILLSANLNQSQRGLLFEAYFKLLSAVPSRLKGNTDAVDEAFQSQLKVLNYFLRLDVADNLNHQLALKYAQICFGASQMQLAQHKYIVYCAQFVYNLFKLSYVRVIANNFKENYKRFCAGFRKLITQLNAQVWFQEFLLLFFQLQISMQPTAGNVFYIFWEQLDDELYALHFDFLQTLLQALANTKQSEVFQYNCCGKEMFSRHNQVTLAAVCIETHGFMLKKHEFCSKEPLAPSMLSVNETLKGIFNHAVNALIDMDNNCKTMQLELQKFNANFTNLMTAVRSPQQAYHFIELAQEYMKYLKSRLSSADRQMLLRRLYQLGVKTEDAATAAELHCFYIAEMLANKDAHSAPLTLHNQVHFFYNGIAAEYVQQGKCLAEIYQHKSDKPNRVFKPLLEKFQIRLLHWLEAQFVLKNYKTDSHAELFVNLAKCCLSKYDFLLIVSAGRLYDRHSIKNKIENIYERLRDTKTNASSGNAVTNFRRMDELILAHAAVLLWTERSCQQDSVLNKNDFMEDNLPKLLQDKSLIGLNVKNEMELIEMALNALNAFRGFYEKADTEAIDLNEGGFIDWSHILEDLTSLAYYFQMSGYIDYAFETWLLHYQIAKTIDDTQNYVRSLAFFCEFSHYFDSDTNTDNKQQLNIAVELAAASKELNNILNVLPQMLRRHQNFTLICLCQISYFYATKGRRDESNSYLKYVRAAHTKLGRSSNDYDIVLFTADVVQFRIDWKLNSSSGDSADKSKQISLFTEFDWILERLKSFVYISSMDKTLFNLLLISTISDFAELAANRLIENTLSAYFACCLSVSVQCGAAVFSVKLLSKWATINLQMEYLQRAEIKFLLIECILGLRDADEVSKSLEQSNKVEIVTPRNESDFMPPNIGLEVARRVAVNSHKTIKINAKKCVSSTAFDLKLNKFLDVNQNEVTPQLHTISTESTKDTWLLWTRFVLGSLRARFNFLAKNNDQLEKFYENCHKWLCKRYNTFHYKIFLPEIMMSASNYANFLRSVQNFDKANKLLVETIKQFENGALSANIDPAYRANLQQQLKATNLEQLELKKRVLPKRKQVISTATLAVTKLPTTPLNKPTRYAPLPMTVGPQNKKVGKTTTAFTIYSDRKVPPPSADKRNLWQNSTSRKDLNFHEDEGNAPNQANDEIVIISDSETETQTPKVLKKPTLSKIMFTDTIDLVEHPKPKAKGTKVSKSKTHKKVQESELGIEQNFEKLTLKTKTTAASDSKEHSPLPTAATENFKTPSSSQASKVSASAKLLKKRQTKQASSTPLCGSSSDTSPPNSNEEQTPSVTAGRRRLRTRTDAVVESSKSTSASSRRRPR